MKSLKGVEDREIRHGYLLQWDYVLNSVDT